MKLTGKCLDAFGDKCKYNYEEFMELPENCQNALVIEFFDSVGIITEQLYIEALKQWFPCVDGVELKPVDSRTEAANAAIEKANEIFNLNNK